MRCGVTAAVVGLLCSLAATRALEAQAPQRVSAQFSAFSTLMTANGTRAIGVGVEPQIRVNGPHSGNRGLSLGVGAQLTQHYFSDGTLTLTGAIVEPRLTYSNTLLSAWYLAARAGLLKQRSDAASSTSGYAVGIGAGSIRAIGGPYLDIGLGVVYQDFADARTPTGRVYQFSGTLAFVAKVGISIGIGG